MSRQHFDVSRFWGKGKIYIAKKDGTDLNNLQMGQQQLLLFV